MRHQQTAANPEEAVVNLKQIAGKTGDLPPIPTTALKALQMMDDLRVSIRDLQAAITKDQALAAKILRIVNSPMYYLSREVSTISHAITMLGMNTVRTIIMAASVQHVFQTGSIRGHDLGTKLMSDHSWGAALAARIIAQHVCYANPEEAFLCGLLHDIGKPVLLKNLTDMYAEIISAAYRGVASFHEIELKSLGFSHAHVGAMLAEKWNFPPQLAEAIGYHHNPLGAPTYPQLACITNLANQAMILLEIGFEKDSTVELHAQPAAESLGLDAGTMESLIADVRKAIEQLSDTRKF